MQQKIYHLHAITGLHVGTGQGIGVIDMPIARERASNLPLVPGSGIKGVLRDESREKEGLDKNDYLALFGPEAGEKASDFAGALAVSDARLLCLPIRSWKGTFAWVTCPMILRRYQRDIDNNLTIPTLQTNTATYCGETVLAEDSKVYLEDLDIEAKSTPETDSWANIIAEQIFADDESWQEQFKQHFLVIHDDAFDFLSETATEIRARIRIQEDTRTVQQGALWYEEYLPAETILWGTLAADKPRNSSEKSVNELLDLLPDNKTRLQIGGNATIGAGQVRWIMGGE